MIKAYPMKIAILGFGREGKSTLAFLQKSKALIGDEVWILDKNRSIKIPRGVHSALGKNSLKNLGLFDIIFRSPGIPYNLPEFVRTRKTGVLFSSATKLFFGAVSHLSSVNSRLLVIGITGTKGKGTTSTILYNILKSAGKDVFLVGNIGTPALNILPRLQSLITHRKSKVIGHKSDVFVIMELSSFQLQDLETSPHIALITEMFPDHQDSHKSLSEYYGAKANIARYQTKSDKVFYFAHNKIGKETAAHGKGKKIAVNPYTPNSRELGNKIRKNIRIPGEHNFKNVFMATVVAKYLGIPTHTIIQTIKKFKSNEHRLEFVRRIRAHPRRNPRTSAVIEFYNDSASTNPHTTAAAINAFPSQSKILIAGGRDKNLNYDYKSLAQALNNSNTKLVVLIGENKKRIARVIKNSGVPIKFAKDLKEAIKLTYQFSTFYIPHSTFSIIFSPGAKSFDLFENYAERGKEFKKIVKKLTSH